MKINKVSLSNLKPNRSRWNNPETIAVRVPKMFKQEVLDYAKQLDNNQVANQVSNKENSTVHKELKEILTKIENKEKGYKGNCATALIKELKAIGQQL